MIPWEKNCSVSALHFSWAEVFYGRVLLLRKDVVTRLGVKRRARRHVSCGRVAVSLVEPRLQSINNGPAVQQCVRFLNWVSVSPGSAPLLVWNSEGSGSSFLPPASHTTVSFERVARAKTGKSWLSGVDVVVLVSLGNATSTSTFGTPELGSRWHQQQIWGSGGGKKVFRIKHAQICNRNFCQGVLLMFHGRKAAVLSGMPQNMTWSCSTHEISRCGSQTRVKQGRYPCNYAPGNRDFRLQARLLGTFIN